MTAGNLHIARSDIELMRQHADEFFIGRSVYGRCRYPHAQRAIVFAHDTATRCSRDNTN
jgi:hypothetical protein